MPERPLGSQQQRNHEHHHRALAQRMTSPFEVVPSLYDPAAPPCIEPLPQDRRFAHERRQAFPAIGRINHFCCNNNGGTTQQPPSGRVRTR